MVELQPSKLATWVRFPSPAPFFVRIFSAGTLLLSLALQILIFTSVEAKTSCKEEREKLCPNANFSSRSERKQCLKNAVNSLPEQCRGGTINSISNGFVNNSSNFSELCSEEIKKFCPTKRSGHSMVAGSESACKHILQRKLKRHGYNYISEYCRNALLDGKDMTVHRHNTGYTYYTNGGYYTGKKRASNPLNKELITDNFYSKNINKIANKTVNQSKNNTQQTNSKYNGTPITSINDEAEQMGAFITLSNGVRISVYRYNEFIKDHQEALRKLTSSERERYINEYFLVYS